MDEYADNGQPDIAVTNGKLCSPTTSDSPGSDIGPTTTIEDIRCQECDISFEKWLDLLQHTSEAHPRLDDQELDEMEEGESGADDSTNDPERKLRTTWCHICKKHLATVSSRNLHMRIHTGERPFVCTECGKAFTQNVHLRSHMSVHTGAKPYSCKICNKGFVAGRTLKIHMMSHTREQPHTCQWCGRKFLIHQHLITHTATHHAELVQQSPSGDEDDNSPLTMVVAPSSAHSADSRLQQQSFQDSVSTPALSEIRMYKRPGGLKRSRPHNGHSLTFDASAGSATMCPLECSPDALVADDDDLLLASIGAAAATTVESESSRGPVLKESIKMETPAATATDTLNLAADIWQKAIKVELPFHTKPVEEEKPRLSSVSGKSSSRRKAPAVSRSSVVKNSAISASPQQQQQQPPQSMELAARSSPVAIPVITDSASSSSSSGCFLGVSSSAGPIGAVVNGSAVPLATPLPIIPAQQRDRAQNGTGCSSSMHSQNSNGSRLHQQLQQNVDSNSNNVVGTSVQQCPNCMVVEGELQLLKTEMAMIKQFLGNKLTLMEQKIDNMHSLIRQ